MAICRRLLIFFNIKICIPDLTITVAIVHDSFLIASKIHFNDFRFTFTNHFIKSLDCMPFVLKSGLLCGECIEKGLYF